MVHSFRDPEGSWMASSWRLPWGPFWRMAPVLLRLFVGVDLRRPASWITLAMGGWMGWWCATSTAADSGTAMLVAAVLTVAAIGDVPLAVCLPTGSSLPRLWAYGWAGARAAWPLVGSMLGMLAAGGLPDWIPMVIAVAVGALLATITTVASRLAGAKAADAASLTLLMSAASVAAGHGLASWLAGSAAGAFATWLFLGGLGWAWSHSQRTAVEVVLPGTHRAGHIAGADVLHVDALPANGPLRQTLSRLAMVTALLAMAGWLMLEPALDPATGGVHDPVGQHEQRDRLWQVHLAAAAWALFTAAWFIGLAVPQATLQDGMAGALRWDGLLRTAALARRGGNGWRWGRWSPRPGPARFAGGVALTQAAVLGWPVLVCAVLSLPTPAAARLPLGIVIGLAAAAAIVSVVVLLGTAVHASRETMFAAALAIVVGALAIASNFIFFAGRPGSPASPSLPVLPPSRLHGLGGG